MAKINGEWQGVHVFEDCWLEEGCEGCTEMCDQCGEVFPNAEIAAHEKGCYIDYSYCCEECECGDSYGYDAIDEFYGMENY
jgi:hypothetical protein